MKFTSFIIIAEIRNLRRLRWMGIPESRENCVQISNSAFVVVIPLQTEENPECHHECYRTSSEEACPKGLLTKIAGFDIVHSTHKIIHGIDQINFCYSLFIAKNVVSRIY